MLNKPPNIIFIITDQQRLDTINALGYNYMRTPNLDRLVENGVSYTNAFCCGATSVAARAALFTGMYPHNTGVYSFDHWSHHSSWIQDLADINYHCVNIGKMHIIPIYDNIGFHERRVIENKCQKFSQYGVQEDEWGWWLRMHGCEREVDRHLKDPNWTKKYNAIAWDRDEELHSDIFCGNTAVSWIKTWNWNKPLFLQIGFPGPHEPYDPPQRFIDLYKDIEVPLPIKSHENLNSKPIQHKAFRHFFKYTKNDESQIDLSSASDSDIIRLRKHYFGNISLIDEKIGEILKALEEVGQLDNSVVIFTSDHGDNLGDHGLPYKWLMYDSIVNIPMVISDFRKNSNINRVDESLVSHIDLGPTILNIAGIENIPQRLEGRSLLQKEVALFPETVFCEDNYLIMMREKKFKLVYYIGQFEDGELYDLQNDPDELNNLWHSLEFKNKKLMMIEKLLRWLTMSNYKNKNYKTNEENKILRLPGSEKFGPFLHGQITALPDDKQTLS